MSLRLLSLQLSIAAVMLASVGQVFADPSDLMEGAQSIPYRQGHKIVSPASSLAGPQDRGIRANTNVRFVVPDRSPARRLSAGGRLFSAIISRPLPRLLASISLASKPRAVIPTP